MKHIKFHVEEADDGNWYWVAYRFKDGLPTLIAAVDVKRITGTVSRIMPMLRQLDIMYDEQEKKTRARCPTDKSYP